MWIVAKRGVGPFLNSNLLPRKTAKALRLPALSQHQIARGGDARQSERVNIRFLMLKLTYGLRKCAQGVAPQWIATTDNPDKLKVRRVWLTVHKAHCLYKDQYTSQSIYACLYYVQVHYINNQAEYADIYRYMKPTSYSLASRFAFLHIFFRRSWPASKSSTHF